MLASRLMCSAHPGTSLKLSMPGVRPSPRRTTQRKVFRFVTRR